MRIADGDQRLVEIDAGLAAAENARRAKGAFDVAVIGRVHAAIAGDGDAQSGFAAQGNGVAERRDQENVAAAADIAGGDQPRAGSVVLAGGIEDREIAADLVADIDEAGGVIGGGEGVLGIGRAGPGQSLVARAGAFDELAFGRARANGRRRANDQREKADSKGILDFRRHSGILFNCLARRLALSLDPSRWRGKNGES